MLQIANITAIALVMVAHKCPREMAELELSAMSFGLLVGHGCKLHRHEDRSGIYFSISGYAHNGLDVELALREADKLAITLRGAECAQSIADSMAFDAAEVARG